MRLRLTKVISPGRTEYLGRHLLERGPRCGISRFIAYCIGRRRQLQYRLWFCSAGPQFVVDQREVAMRLDRCLP